jgi:RNA polymerase primary sigma factor
LVEANLRLVAVIARRFAGRGLAFDDLVAEGNLGLIRAAGRYDPRFGTRFSTYAGHWIKQAIRHALINTTSTIRLPSHMVVLLTRWGRAERALRRELGHDPGFDRVADRLGLSEARRAAVGKALRALQVGSAAGGDQDNTGSEEPADGAPPPRTALEAEEAKQERRAALGLLLDHLDARERRVVSLRFGLGGQEPVTLKEVGDQVGLTREWVRKLQLRALAKMEAACGEGPWSDAEAALCRAVRARFAGARAVPGWDEVVEVARGLIPPPVDCPSLGN